MTQDGANRSASTGLGARGNRRETPVTGPAQEEVAGAMEAPLVIKIGGRALATSEATTATTTYSRGP